DADRALHPLHGVREHPWRQDGAPLAAGLRLRAGARLRLFVLPPELAAARRLAPRHLTAELQPRRRAGAAFRARPYAAGARVAVQAGNTGARGGHSALGDRGALGVALDDRPGEPTPAVPFRVAGARRRLSGERAAGIVAAAGRHPCRMADVWGRA